MVIGWLCPTCLSTWPRCSNRPCKHQQDPQPIFNNGGAYQPLAAHPIESLPGTKFEDSLLFDVEWFSRFTLPCSRKGPKQ